MQKIVKAPKSDIIMQGVTNKQLWKNMKSANIIIQLSLN